MSEAAQDIDSGSGKIVTPGAPVQHRDVEDGVSVGHTAEPEHSEGSDGNQEPAATAEPIPAEPPPKTSLDDIYKRSVENRQATIDGELAEMDADERRHYDRMVAEAGGGDDPFDQDEPAGDEQQPAQQAKPAQSQPGQAQKNAAEGIDPNAEMTTITVYGMKEQVPTAEVLAAGGLSTYQKIRAADLRMERLSSYETSLRNWEEQLSARQADRENGRSPAQDGTGITESSPTDAQGDTADVDSLSLAITEAIYDGDRDVTREKISAALASIKTDAVRTATAQAGASAPTGQAEAQQSAEIAARREANAVFLNEFKELDTPVLRQATLSMVEKVSKDPVMFGRPLAEITREACSRVYRDVFHDDPPAINERPANPNPPAPGKPLIQPPPVNDLSQRHALKRRTVISPLTAAHGREPAPASQEQSFPSNKEFVAKLKASRGQPA